MSWRQTGRGDSLKNKRIELTYWGLGCPAFLFFLQVLFLKKSIPFLAVLGLLCCEGFSLVVVSEGYSLVAVRGALAVAPLAVALRLQGTLASVAVAPGLWSTDSVVETLGLSCLLQGMWDLPISGIEPLSSALGGRVFTTEPPEKPSSISCPFLVWNTGGDTCAHTRTRIHTGD